MATLDGSVGTDGWICVGERLLSFAISARTVTAVLSCARGSHRGTCSLPELTERKEEGRRPWTFVGEPAAKDGVRDSQQRKRRFRALKSQTNSGPIESEQTSRFPTLI
eukprot:1950615-Rhodomonas_salina.4